MTVGQVAARSGLALSALRFYEKRGLITSRRAAGGRRRYSPEVLQRVTVIKAAQGVGIPLSVIAVMLGRVPTAPSAADWGSFLRRWQADLAVEIAALARFRAEINACARCGCLSFEACPLVRPAARG